MTKKVKKSEYYNRRRRMAAAVLVLVCVFCLSGCGVFDFLEGESAREIDEITQEAANPPQKALPD